MALTPIEQTRQNQADLKTGLALSIQQPWAWLIIKGYKDVENRTWRTNTRGWVGVHAGKKFDQEGYDWVRERFPEIPLPEPGKFDMGAIVGRMLISDCVSRLDSPWFFGPYGFVIAKAEPLGPMPCRGMQGFFKPWA